MGPAGRIWIDDRNVIFRRGVASCLKGEGFTVVGESSDFDPDPQLDRTNILLFDVEVTGLQRAARLTRDSSVHLVGIAPEPEEQLLFDAVEAGMAGFLIRGELTPEGLVACLRAVASGNGALPPALLTRLLGGLARGGRKGATTGQLAGREVEVLRLLAEGGGTREIAGKLCYSERTVKNIVHDVLVKMNCRTRAHAVALATRQGLI
ncbi:MAG: response regulator transcription factor [Actinomycetota bacterium]|nr:response regulator transcription factor [Actinomycetota bacterium]